MTRPPFFPAPDCRRQAGFSLALALAMLTMLTTLGITALSITALEEKMAGNIQQEHVAFQGAETGLAVLWTVADGVTTGDTRGNDVTTTIICRSGLSPCNAAAEPRDRVTVETDAWYQGPSVNAPPGFSMDSGIVRHHFNLGSTSTHVGKRSEVYAGFYRVGPGEQSL